MAQLNDCKFLALRDLGYTGAIDDMELAWGADNGLPEGTVGVPWYNALINAGVTPSHINDMEAEFWCGTPTPPTTPDGSIIDPQTANNIVEPNTNVFITDPNV